eukprot:symbB.v1.2.010245.t1/scaffold663.1/size175208/1
MSPPPHDVEEQGEPKSATHLPDTAAARKARMQALCAKRSLQAKKEHEERKAEDERTTERWSGFRIVDRCIRQEKWDAAMRGKDIVPIQHLGGLLRSRHNKVVIGVLFGIGKPQTNQSCEWKITDLNRESPSEASLIFTGRAFEHWSASKDVKVGQILGILNPELSCRSGVRVLHIENPRRFCVKLRHGAMAEFHHPNVPENEEPDVPDSTAPSLLKHPTTTTLPGLPREPLSPVSHGSSTKFEKFLGDPPVVPAYSSESMWGGAFVILGGA